MRLIARGGKRGRRWQVYGNHVRMEDGRIECYYRTRARPVDRAELMEAVCEECNRPLRRVPTEKEAAYYDRLAKKEGRRQRVVQERKKARVENRHWWLHIIR